MKIMKTIAVLCTISASCFLFGQKPSTYLFGIGATQDQVRSHAGNPEMLYWVADHKFYDFSEESTLLRIDPRVEDIYERASGGNTFRIMLRYGVDTSISRLHPTERVSRVIFTPDHSARFRILMNEIPEVVALCKDGCAMAGIVGAGIPEVHACRPPKYPNETAIMNAAASDWFPSQDQEFTYEYCVRVTFENRSDSYHLTPGQTWDDLTVDQIEIGPGLDPHADKLVAIGAEKEYDLGVWKPNA